MPGFWTDAVRLQQRVIAESVTPIKALHLGLMVDVEALDLSDKAQRDDMAEFLRSLSTGP